MRASFGLAFPSPAGVVWDRDGGTAKGGGLRFVVGSAELRVLCVPVRVGLQSNGPHDTHAGFTPVRGLPICSCQVDRLMLTLVC